MKISSVLYFTYCVNIWDKLKFGMEPRIFDDLKLLRIKAVYKTVSATSVIVSIMYVWTRLEVLNYTCFLQKTKQKNKKQDIN